MIESVKYKLELVNIDKPSKQPKAAVLIGICNYMNYIDHPALIYTVRSSNLSSHSGEVSFPGGKEEDGDLSLQHTALREAKEEINLNPDDVNFLGRMNYLISKHKIEVNPFVASIDSPQTFIKNSEIEHIFTVPIKYLLEKGNIQEETIERQGSKWIVPTWHYENQKIWGLTAMITVNFLNHCFDAGIAIRAD
ncbi:MAG: CoA pyrophosphatase [Gammaproteobacteria bacterium]